MLRIIRPLSKLRVRRFSRLLHILRNLLCSEKPNIFCPIFLSSSQRLTKVASPPLPESTTVDSKNLPRKSLIFLSKAGYARCLFWQIFDFFCGDSIRNKIQSPQKESKTRLKRTRKATEPYFRKRSVLLLLLLPSFARADWDHLFSDTEDPSLFHHVHVISGHLNLSFQDTLIEGAHSLPIMRTYTSAGALERSAENIDLMSKHMRGGWMVQGGWNVFPHTNLLLEIGRKKENYQIYLAERSGNIIHYTYSHREGKYLFYYRPDTKHNQSPRSLSARTNIENYLLRFNFKSGEAVLFLPDGGYRTYHGETPRHLDQHIDKTYYRLISERLPSRHQIDYIYDKKNRLTDIALKNPDGTKTFTSLHFHLESTKSPFHYKIQTSDNKTLDYQAILFEGRDYLSTITSTCRPLEDIQYIPARKHIGARLNRFSLGGALQFQAQYYTPSNDKEAQKWIEDPKKRPFSADRVRTLEAPIGPQGQLRPIAQFSYIKGQTDVRDVDNFLMRYHHDKGRIFSIEYFNEKDLLHSTLKFVWDKQRLLAKAMLDQQATPHVSKTFQYDSLGNVTQETLWGNLTGNATALFSLNAQGQLVNGESYSKRYTYQPHFNLPLLEEEDNGLTYRYHYKEKTDLLEAKFTCDRNKILIREFYIYNADHLLTAEIIDDGSSTSLDNLTDVTTRHIKRYDLDPSTGLARSLTEMYLDLSTHTEQQIRHTRYTYSPQHKVIKEEIDDATGTYRYTIYTDYDPQGHVIRKTNPLGQVSTYTYNQQGDLLTSHEVGSPKKTYTYNSFHHPITCQEIDDKGTITTISNLYDFKGRLLSQTDTKGNTITQHYDPFGHCSETILPAVTDESGTPYNPTLHFTYDIQGNLTSSTDPQGNTTRTYYNALRKPIRIIHPDGTETHHRYHLCGTLAQTIYSDGTQIDYTYDLFQRMTKKTISYQDQILSTETWTYNAFQLLSTTDSSGLTTTYTYDHAGRKIEENTGGRLTTYTYDALGFLERTSQMNTTHVELHDSGGRIVEVWDEPHLENHMIFSYDTHNRKEKALRYTAQGTATDHFTHDSTNRLTSHIDPHGNLTQILYDETHLNDLNQHVLQKITIDPLGHHTIETHDAADRVILIEKTNASHNTLAREQILYDRAGNPVHHITIVFIDDQPLKQITYTCHYDSMGRVLSETEANQKITLYTYDQRGRLASRTLPRHITLFYTYDGLDRLLELSSSDETIHYRYIYALGPHPIQIDDLIQHTTLQRTYNPFNELIDELTPYNHRMHWDYDQQGHCTQIQLPDHSSIHYDYDGQHLTKIRRHAPHITYEHTYIHDINGHIAQEQLILNQGIQTTTRDLLERPIAQSSPYHHHTTHYGPSGLVIQTTNSLFTSKDYIYDALNQLIQEGTQTYHFDSLGNPTNCHVNDLNQILSTPTTTFHYDSDGNPTQRTTTSETLTYDYDALGRLITIHYPDHHINYIYDPLSRLIAKETPDETLHYIYDHDTEIGTILHNTITQLKVLGQGLKGDIGAAIAIEIDNTPYIPLHDFNGTIIALLSNHHLIETYDIDGFGKETSPSSLNPWRFCSKRHDESLIFFGQRFYDPLLGRWLTPDPSGFADGPNLYIYVLNSPLNRLDLFGLNSERNYPTDIRINVPIETFFRLPSYNAMIPCKGFINDVAVDWFVSCGHWHKLQFTPEEQQVGTVNIIDHLSEIMPKEGMLVGLITAQNGISTSAKEFSEMSRSITSKIPEGTLFIGLHNPSSWLPFDVSRTFKERKGKETPTVARTRQFMGAIAESLHKINPNLLWTHIPHSEGGVIARRAIEGLTPEQQTILRKQLYLYTIGSAMPIPINYASNVVNVYSKKDHITKRYGKEYRNNPDYDIQMMPCTSTRSNMTMYFADHKFLGQTYQASIEDRISKLRNVHGFYDGQN